MGDDVAYKFSKVNKFMYLGLVVHDNSNFKDDVRNRIMCGWMKWR